jgi:hypothetical protein
MIRRFIAWLQRPSRRERVLDAMHRIHAGGDKEMRGLVIADMAGCRGTVYIALHGLEDEGLVQSRAAPELAISTLGGRTLQRRMYWLTEAGMQERKRKHEVQGDDDDRG